ncbi:hypothetical protein Aph01nite_08310 [Acrocarpospora phusangensis]|uniref:Uncharacterized protein n=1 Tax=Acrocarpospora phusangensis TaxID=1070424 RepID=A0A919Q6K5_9ACTN|nr:hypothetical protein [Acrocarpospora phusangensis]GIH22521.1 hypothetical protein Aph01nite_08310 [Acrocarpospora phusangensis]
MNPLDGHPVTIRIPTDPDKVVWGIGRLHPNGWDHCVRLAKESKPGEKHECCCGLKVTLQPWGRGVMPWSVASHPDPDCKPGPP